MLTGALLSQHPTPPSVAESLASVTAERPTLTPQDASSASSVAAPSPATLTASVPIGVRIPAIGVDARLVTLGLDGAGAMQVPSDGTAVGWYDQSPTPGERGPTVLAGHVTWGARPAVFFNLGALVPGQRIEVDRSDGAVVSYDVTAVDQFPKDDFPTLRVYGNTDGPELRVITCGGEFDDEAGHHEDNIVISGRMVLPTS